jgi:protein-S-isoprenylcysteine O-methyltransferase Ste14
VLVRVDHELVQAGPYRFVRHPIYSGIILMFAAIVLLVGRVAGIGGRSILPATRLGNNTSLISCSRNLRLPVHWYRIAQKTR